MIRLDKFLADMQVGTRSEVKQFLKKGYVTVNDEIVKKPETKIDPANDRVCFDNQEIIYETEFYFLLNKPEGVISASRDKKAYTVVNLLSAEDYRPDLFPVGRLDKDTTGLLLISNNGALSHNMLSPAHHVDKTYLVHLETAAGIQTQLAFEQGIDIGDEKPTLPAKMVPVPEHDADGQEIDWLHESLERIESVLDPAKTSFLTDDRGTDQDVRWSNTVRNFDKSDISESKIVEGDKDVCNSSHYAFVTIHEGRFHQIKRMFSACGQEVIRLRRMTMGPLRLDSSLKEGEYRRLTTEELDSLREYR